MATVDLTKVQVPQSEPGEAVQLPRNLMINRDRYDLRIKKCEFEISKKKGNKMLKLELEIYNPVSITHYLDGKQYEVMGMTCRKYVMLETPENLVEVGAFMKRLGLAPAIDPENPDTEQFVGKAFSDIVSPKEYQKRKQPTAQQLQDDPNHQGDPILDPETGKPEIGYGIETGFGLGDVKRAMKQPAAGF